MAPSKLSMARIAKTTDASPRGPNQSEEQHVGAIDPRADQAQSDGERSNEREAQQGVRDNLDSGVVDRHGQERRTEDEPHHQGQEFPAQLGQLSGPLAVCRAEPQQRTERDPCDERSDEAIAIEGRSRFECAEADGQGGDARAPRAHPRSTGRGVEQHGPTGSRARRRRRRRSRVRRVLRRPRTTALRHEPELAGRQCQHQGHDRGGEAVVEATLHVETAPESRRDALVVDDLHAERSVRRRQRGPDEAGERPRQRVEHETGDHATERDRERQADPEQPHRQRQVTTQLRQIDARRIGEQHQRQRQLGEEMDGVHLDIDRHRTPVGIGHDVADGDEDERSGDAVATEQAGQRGPREDQQGDDERGGL
jgi:hypothetical protein